MKEVLTLLLFLTVSTLLAQSVHETEFYKFILPVDYKATSSPTIKEEFSNVDSFMLFQHESPKYLVFVSSNILTDNFDGLTLTNCKDYLTDIGEITVTGVEKIGNSIRLTFLQDDNDITYIAYLTATNDILNRFIFFVPSKTGNLYYEEIAEIVRSVKYKKSHW